MNNDFNNDPNYQNNNFNNMNNYNNQNYQNNNFNNNQTNGYYQAGNQNYQEIDTSEYGSFDQPNNSGGKKVVFIILAIIIVIAIIAVIVFFVMRGNKDNNKPSGNKGNNNIPNVKADYKKYNEDLISYAKTYFVDDSLLPSEVGTCKKVTLKELADKALVTNDFDESCSEEDTYVTVCKLESGNYHYSTTFSCSNEDLQVQYGDWQDGNETDLDNYSEVKFTYMLQEIEVPKNLDNVVEDTVWKDELNLPEGSYAITGEKTYYRYRDILYRWEIKNDYYYQKNGPINLTNKFKVSEYYVNNPNASYPTRGDSATVYKWYRYVHEAYNDGAYYSTCPDNNYPVRGESKVTHKYTTDSSIPLNSYTTRKNATLYHTRTITNDVTKVTYICINNANKTTNNSDIECSKNPSMTEAGFNSIDKYVCTFANGRVSTQSTPCEPQYSAWGEYTLNKCDTSKGTCESVSGYDYSITSYKWYTNSKKAYYPSGSETANGETIYYKDSPINNAIKDESTKTTAYKWYYTTTSDLGYAKSTPKVGATMVKGDQKYSAWSNYSLSKVAGSSTREVQSRVQLTIKKTQDGNGSSTPNYKNLSDKYLSYEDLIKLANSKGYNVATLSDIDNISNLRYLVKISYRKVK